MTVNFQKRSFDAGKIFTPSTPIRESELFQGRAAQVGTILDAISQPGAHAILYGERGVGKTSLSNVLSDFLSKVSDSVLLPRVNCVADDTYSAIWKRMLDQMTVTEKRPGVGFRAADLEITKSALEGLGKRIGPDDVRKVLEDISEGIVLVLVFDEFDRVRDRSVRVQMADTVKILSDYNVPATIMLIGVADSVVDLVGEHLSIERALIQVPMPRMSSREIEQIVSAGLARLEIIAQPEALAEIRDLSQGLPHIAHLLGLHCSREALKAKTLYMNAGHVGAGIASALQRWDQSVMASYYSAVSSPQPGHMFKEVLLACAVAKTDEFGYFAPGDVRAPLCSITGKQYKIANFSRHLSELADPARGGMLTRTGTSRRYRFRFTSPLMRPYVVMRSYADGLVDRDSLRDASRAA